MGHCTQKLLGDNFPLNLYIPIDVYILLTTFLIHLMEVMIKVHRFYLLLLSLFLLFGCGSETPNQSNVQEGEWTCIVYGDTRGGYDVHQKLAHFMTRVEPKPLGAFCVGDMITKPGDLTQWYLYWGSARPLDLAEIPLYLVKGNHDAKDSATTEIYNEQVGYPSSKGNYTIQMNTMLIVILDTEQVGKAGRIGSAQFAWLESVLDSAESDRSITHVIPLLHRPLYPQGSHKGEDLKNADELHELFLQQSKLKTVIAGHDHMFDKFEKDGITYVETGGGGAPLNLGEYYHFIKITSRLDGTLNFKTIGIFNETVDEWDL